MNPPTSDHVLDLLVAGNERFVAGRCEHPRCNRRRRTELLAGQHPIAVIICCSDSRVPPEFIFDQGLGDLFVIRVAGNIIDDVVLGSIEYAVAHLDVSLVMVMGHSSCGAVIATVAGSTPVGHLAPLMAAIQPAVDRAVGQPGDLADNAARINTEMIVEHLCSSSPVLADLVGRSRLRIVAGFYDLATGRVEINP